MLDLKKHLGVQSYCFRGFKEVPALIAQIKGIGLTRTEICAVHVDFDDEKRFVGVIGDSVMSCGRVAGRCAAGSLSHGHAVSRRADAATRLTPGAVPHGQTASRHANPAAFHTPGAVFA